MTAAREQSNLRAFQGYFVYRYRTIQDTRLSVFVQRKGRARQEQLNFMYLHLNVRSPEELETFDSCSCSNPTDESGDHLRVGGRRMLLDPDEADETIEIKTSGAATWSGAFRTTHRMDKWPKNMRNTWGLYKNQINSNGRIQPAL